VHPATSRTPPCCSVEKAKQLLGVEIKYSIMDIFYDYIAWQKQLRNL
jgi:nucleoside-diphosphate-sugar epimerase